MVREKNAWIITPKEVDGKVFGEIYKGDELTRKFLGNNFAMAEHIRHLRNEMVKKQMMVLSAEDDPNNDDARADCTLTKPKRDLVDQLPKVLTVIVQTASMEVSVNVLTEWRSSGVLQLEITLTNLELLLEEPPAVSAPWKPTIDSEKVHWVPSRKKWMCKYWDSRAIKSRYKYIGVDVESEVSDEAKQDLVNRAKDELERFYDEHHNRSGNMPCSDGMASEVSGGDSAPKRMKTDE